MHVQITKKTVETIEAPEARELLLRDTELKGFGVRISPTGAKTFFAEGNFKRSRQTKRLTLGRYPIISVDSARTKAREVLVRRQNCGEGAETNPAAAPEKRLKFCKFTDCSRT